MICDGCGAEISETDSPNIIIGKNPKQFCAKCVKYGRIISASGGGWAITELVPDEEEIIG